MLGLDLAFYGYFSLPLLLYIGGGTAVIGLVLLILGIILFTKKRGGVSEAQAERARLRLETENDSAAIADEEEALGADAGGREIHGVFILLRESILLRRGAFFLQRDKLHNGPLFRKMWLILHVYNMLTL